MNLNTELDYILELTAEEEMMADTINTEHKNYKDSDEEKCFKRHQKNIVKLKSLFRTVKSYQSYFRQIRGISKDKKVADLAHEALSV
mgnify:CR=1 FL=1